MLSRWKVVEVWTHIQLSQPPKSLDATMLRYPKLVVKRVLSRFETIGRAVHSTWDPGIWEGGDEGYSYVHAVC